MLPAAALQTSLDPLRQVAAAQVNALKQLLSSKDGRTALESELVDLRKHILSILIPTRCQQTNANVHTDAKASRIQISKEGLEECHCKRQDQRDGERRELMVCTTSNTSQSWKCCI